MRWTGPILWWTPFSGGGEATLVSGQRLRQSCTGVLPTGHVIACRCHDDSAPEEPLGLVNGQRRLETGRVLP